jgi:Asp-tRNA(Asn)/Glu-tRNA(Gln) amidotransferase C subunit
MSKFTKEMVDDYANKLLIGLSEEENKLVLSEFDIIDANMELISNMPGISEIEPMTHALDDFYCTPNNDLVDESPSINELLQNCDVYEDREVKVPRVVGGSE